MSGFLIDTNVLSEFARRDGPDERVATWLRETRREAQFVFPRILFTLHRCQARLSQHEVKGKANGLG